MDVIYSDETFTPAERQWIRKFHEEVQRRVGKDGSQADLSMFSISDAIGMNLADVHKEGPVMYALWVCLLTVLREYRNSSQDYKYPTFEAFVEAYPTEFQHESKEEQEKLWQIANWMFILFTLIPARKNKGLAMQVVPKLVEGWQAKYVTGSGQTRLTANRVRLFETEGDIRANHRGRVKPKKKAPLKRSTHPRATPKKDPESKPKKRKHSQSLSSSEPVPKRVTAHEDITDADSDDSSVNEEVCKTFDLWRQQSTHSVEALNENSAPEFLRSSSVFDLSSTILSGPGELQRGVSWTEIPISYTLNSNSNSNSNSQYYTSSTSSSNASAPYLIRGFTSSQPIGSPVQSFSQVSNGTDLLQGDSQSSSTGLMAPPVLANRQQTGGYRRTTTGYDMSSSSYPTGFSALLEPKTVKDLFSGYHMTDFAHSTTPHF